MNDNISDEAKRALFLVKETDLAARMLLAFIVKNFHSDLAPVMAGWFMTQSASIAHRLGLSKEMWLHIATSAWPGDEMKLKSAEGKMVTRKGAYDIAEAWLK